MVSKTMKGFSSVLFLFTAIVQTSMAQEGYESNKQRMMKTRRGKKGESNFFPPIDPTIAYDPTLPSQGKKGHGGKSFANRSPTPPTPPFIKSHKKGKGNSQGKGKSKNPPSFAPSGAPSAPPSATPSPV